MSRKSFESIGRILAAGMLVAASAAAAPNAVHRDFDGDAAGGEPAFFRYEGTPGLPAERWKAIPDAAAFSKSQVGVQTVSAGQPGQFHFALSSQAGAFEDGSVQGLTRSVARGNARGGIVGRYVDRHQVGRDLILGNVPPAFVRHLQLHSIAASHKPSISNGMR